MVGPGRWAVWSDMIHLNPDVMRLMRLRERQVVRQFNDQEIDVEALADLDKSELAQLGVLKVLPSHTFDLNLKP